MFRRFMGVVGVAGLAALSVVQLGCACREKCVSTAYATEVQTTTVADLPPNAVPGECYAKVFIPPRFETRTERVMVKEASEHVEITPAEFDWVEERVMVKAASTRLEEIPAEYAWREQTVEVEPGHTEWTMERSARCVADNGQPVRDVFCLVSTPPRFETVRTQCLVKPASVREVTIPAEYQTVRVQKCVKPAQSRKVCIPAEYQTVEKRVKVGEGYMEWQKVLCEVNTTTETINQIEGALAAAGFNPGPADGVFTDQTETALKEYQKEEGLAVGGLTYETLDHMGINHK